MGKSTTNILLGFLAGAAAGAIAGILFAPDKGSETRKNLANKAQRMSEDLKENIGGRVDNLKEVVSDFVDDVRGRFTKIESDVKEQAKQAARQTIKTNETKIN